MEAFELSVQPLHELDEFDVKLLNSKGHDVIEGEFEEHFADFLLESSRLGHHTRIFLFFLLLFFDFPVDLFLDFLYLSGVLVVEPPLVVDYFQKLLPVVLVHVGVTMDLLLDVLKDPFLVLAFPGEDDGFCPWDSILNLVFLVNCPDVLFQEISLIIFDIFICFLETIHQIIFIHRAPQEIIGIEVLGVPGGEVQPQGF